MAHPMTLIDAHQVDVYAQTSENDCTGDRDEQNALEKVCFPGLHETRSFRMAVASGGNYVMSWPADAMGLVASYADNQSQLYTQIAPRLVRFIGRNAFHVEGTNANPRIAHDYVGRVRLVTRHRGARRRLSSCQSRPVPVLRS